MNRHFNSKRKEIPRIAELQYITIAFISHGSKTMLKILQQNHEKWQLFMLDLKKGKSNTDDIANIMLAIRTQQRISENSNIVL